MNIAIMGAGGIANAMARTVNSMEGMNLYAIASRSHEKALKFAAEYNIEKAYGSYEEMAEDENIDLVYIATPHSHHFEHAKLCLTHGRNVLCEKAFTVNAAQAEELFKIAKDNNAFITEAFWTRYMPSMKIIKDVLESGAIGKPMMLTANQGASILDVPRIVEPELAGGALLDSTVYPINFAVLMFGWDFEKYDASATFYKTGVDMINSISLCYPDGRMAVINASIASSIDSRVIISGTEGRLVIEGTNNPVSIKLYGKYGDFKENIKIPKQITGYEYEVEACADAIKAGKHECEEMPHEETIRVMKFMDEIRAGWGFKYPFEK